MIAGTLVGGLLVNRVGRKNLTVLASVPSIIIATAAYVLMVNVTEFWLFITMRWVSGFLAGLSTIAAVTLALEQVSRYRGTMMSLNSALSGTGNACGVFFGGLLINFLDDPLVGYPLLMVILGAIGMVGTLLILFFAKDPARPQNVPKS